MILTDTYQEIYNDLYTKALLIRAMPYILAIIGIIAIVWALCSITRSLRGIAQSQQEISEMMEKQNSMIAAQLKIQYASYKGYNTYEPTTEPEQTE